MPRTTRQPSESGCYHIMLRGIGRQLLFEDTNERRMFLDIAKHYCDDHSVTILAWCLMGNHAHLLLRDPDGVPSDTMKLIEQSFAQRHNRAAGHVGHVFENRFKCKPIETDEQLLACVRYIHNNPQKAGFCAASDYPWSSYCEYVGAPQITDTQFVLGILGGVDEFEDFSACEDDAYAEPEDRTRITDEEARERMKDVLSDIEIEALSHGTRATRDESLRKLKQADLSVRQIERLTGIGRSIVHHA